MNGTQIEQMLDNLLAMAVAAVTAPPARQFVATGGWAHDCECVAVALTDYSVETTVNPACAWQDVLTFEASVLRCYPTADANGKPPEVAEITAASKLVAADAGDLVSGLLDAWADRLLFPAIAELGQCGAVRVLGARARGPEGGLAGWTVSLTVRP